MRRTLVLLFLLAACASRDGVIDETIRDCDAGQEVSVNLYLNLPEVMMESATDNLTVVVEIGNNADRAIEVKAIRVEPGYTAQERYAIESSYREFKQVIEAGDDEKFELPVRGVGGTREIYRRRGNDVIAIVLSVYMAGGDVYRCEYNVPAPR
ncbi:MAG TPA: hypothetical protein VGQ36_11580 [Thermoanaerobaculia bacterium]|jgi:hypothetical protein|nr:hypothetical protein [Thermoanaerobaculia bacterium]